MRFKPIADNGALRSLQNFTAETKDYSADEHQPEHVVQSSHGEHELPSHAEHAGDDENDSGSDFVDEGSTEERDDDVRERVDRIEQVELGLAQLLVVLVIVVLLDVLLQSLSGGWGTLGLSKQYS